jgi:hypothetical protein
MMRFLVVLGLLLGGAALAGGVIHLVHVDDAGQVEFAPRIDTTAFGWWMNRVQGAVESASTLDEAARLETR